MFGSIPSQNRVALPTRTPTTATGGKCERWVTLGQAENATLLVVVHTFEQLSDTEARVRIISARKATTREREQYESGQGR